MTGVAYKVLVDGDLIATITLYRDTQAQRDLVRRQIAREHKIPAHYLRFYPVQHKRSAA